MNMLNFPFLISSAFNFGLEFDVIGPILQFNTAHSDNMIIDMPNGNLNGTNNMFTK